MISKMVYVTNLRSVDQDLIEIINKPLSVKLSLKATSVMHQYLSLWQYAGDSDSYVPNIDNNK